MLCFFASDLHGRIDRYRKLFRAIAAERPQVVLLGGDLFPHFMARSGGDPSQSFLRQDLIPRCRALARDLGAGFPHLVLILGNDDGRACEEEVRAAAAAGVWHYAHGRCIDLGGFTVYGYAYVPPTPFQLKDWERYDVSRYVDPGCVSPEEGRRTVDVAAHELRHATIADDLAALVGGHDLRRSILLFHSPPYRTKLDRTDMDGRTIDGVPVDVHVGSLAIRRLVEERQPLASLHGHIHESARVTGSWRDRVGRTHAFSAAHDGPELALVRFDPDDLDNASRELI